MIFEKIKNMFSATRDWLWGLGSSLNTAWHNFWAPKQKKQVSSSDSASAGLKRNVDFQKNMLKLSYNYRNLVEAIEGKKSLDVISPFINKQTVKTEHRWTKNTPLILAIIHGAALNVIQALLDAGASINHQNNAGKTALMCAFEQNASPEIIKVLIGVDDHLSSQDIYGKTVLMYAIESEASPDIIEYFIDASVKIGTNLNLRDINKKSALMRAIEHNASPEIIKCLIKYLIRTKQANFNLRDKDGKTALDIAIDLDRGEIVPILTYVMESRGDNMDLTELQYNARVKLIKPSTDLIFSEALPYVFANPLNDPNLSQIVQSFAYEAKAGAGQSAAASPLSA